MASRAHDENALLQCFNSYWVHSATNIIHNLDHNLSTSLLCQMTIEYLIYEKKSTSI